MVYVSPGSVEMKHVLDLIQLFVPGAVSEIGLAWSEGGWEGYGRIRSSLRVELRDCVTVYILR
jgi:hypothetical protein